ncbi:MAG: lipoprotein [Pseudomonadota bacterium]
MKNSIIILTLLAISLTACGKKGKLYLPDEPQNVEESTKSDEAK